MIFVPCVWKKILSFFPTWFFPRVNESKRKLDKLLKPCTVPKSPASGILQLYRQRWSLWICGLWLTLSSYPALLRRRLCVFDPHLFFWVGRAKHLIQSSRSILDAMPSLLNLCTKFNFLLSGIAWRKVAVEFSMRLRFANLFPVQVPVNAFW